jgi:DNA invertase Pin-like site-specific DNA recombinase
MREEAIRKVRSAHLQRNAYLYIRQSTLRQVMENTESTQRQYALRERALALGWGADQVVVIDSDLGQSGASAADREGFQRLVTEVGLGNAGIVMGLEVSRLARNSTDWHRLIEICALAGTLILDEDGVYDPAHFNDRLLLGLKGTMSEAELHVLKARLQGGILNKARRGELEGPLPIGFVYDACRRVALDPDQQVQGAIRFLFDTFRRTGSALATMHAFREQGLSFPRRTRAEQKRGEIVWTVPEHSRILWILHNPRYAGAFFYGRTRQRKIPSPAGKYKKLPMEEWTALIRDAHEAYISWEEFEENQRRLLENARMRGDDRRHSPAREGPALLQGILICGRCGQRMTLRYHQRHGRLVPDYTCIRELVQAGGNLCQVVPGASIDAAIGEMLVEAVTPMALEVALAVEQEIHAREGEADLLKQKQVERMRYEAELARRRYMQVDPDNRLVAASLEAEWNAKLRALGESQEEYERQREASSKVLSEEQRRDILALATDFPRLWRDPVTPDRERKRMVRLLIEDVTLIKDQQVSVHVRFRGGATRTLTLPRAPRAWELKQTPREVVARVDELLDGHTCAEIAAILNEEGLRSGAGKPLTMRLVWKIQQEYKLRPRYERLREAGMITQEEVADRLGVAVATVKIWRQRGWLKAHAYSDRHDYLYEPPGDDAPVKYKWKKRSATGSSRQTTTAESRGGAV